MKSAPFAKLPAIALSLLVVLIATGFFWVQNYNPFGSLKGAVDPAGVAFVAQDAPLSLSLGVNPDRLLSVRSPLAFGASKTQQELENFRDSLLGLGTLDYKTQVQPWLGDEVTLAVTSLDVDRDAADGKQPGYLMVLPTKDAVASRAFLQAFWRVRAPLPTVVTTERYEGTEITYGKVKSTLPQQDVLFTLASAVVGDRYVLFANSPKVLKDSINNVQATELSLKSSAIYQRAIGALPKERFGQLYVNLPQFTALTGDRSIAKALAQLPEVSPVTYTHLAMGLRGTRSGLIGETVLLDDLLEVAKTDEAASGVASEAASEPLSVLAYLPSQSMTVATGRDLKALWQQVTTAVKGYRSLESLQKQVIAPIAAQTQLDVVKDIFQGITGEYGFALLKPMGTPKFNEPIDWVFAVKRSTSPGLTGVIEAFDRVARSRGLNLGPVQLGSQTVQAWTQLSSGSADSLGDTLQAKTLAAHATIGDVEVFSTSLAVLKDLLKQVELPLDQSQDWQAATKDFKAASNFFYVDWRSAQPWVEQKLPGLRLLELLAQPVVSHVKSLTISSREGDEAIGRGMVKIGVK